jgi:tetratricopeptide (TPR) repeat protein
VAEGRYATGRASLEEAVAIARELGDRRHLAHYFTGLAEVSRYEGDDAEARRLLEEALALSQEVGDKAMFAEELWSLGSLAYRAGDHREACECHRQSLSILRELGDRSKTCRGLEGYAASLGAAGDGPKAARLLGAAEALRAALGSPLPPGERAEHGQWLAAARAALGDEGFAVAWAEGRTMSWEEAVAYALAEEEAPEAPTP